MGSCRDQNAARSRGRTRRAARSEFPQLFQAALVGWAGPEGLISQEIQRQKAGWAEGAQEDSTGVDSLLGVRFGHATCPGELCALRRNTGGKRSRTDSPSSLGDSQAAADRGRIPAASTDVRGLREGDASRIAGGVPRGQAGPNLVAQVGLLLTKYRMSHRLAAGYLETHFGIPCSIGWISKLQTTAANALASPYEQIAEQMKRAGVVHLDETSYRLEHKSGWLWGAITAGLSLFRIAGSRAGQVAREMLGEGFPGIVVSDRYSGYHWLKTIQRQLCWSHLKRDFTKLAESKYEPTRQVGQQLLELQSRIFRDWHRFQAGQLARSTLRRKVPGWEGEMHALLERGWLTGPRKAAGLCRNVWKYFDALWTFLRLPGVEPTNNTAERGLRGGVIKRKLSFGVESQSGRAFLERTISVLATCRQRGINESAYLAACVQAHYAGETAPDLLEWA